MYLEGCCVKTANRGTDDDLEGSGTMSERRRAGNTVGCMDRVAASSGDWQCEAAGWWKDADR